MSGHSKWAQIHRQKGVADQKRGMIFTKLGRAITIAAREGGGDPDSNFKLRLAIDRAKQANMPKDNIERAIKHGTGEGSEETIKEVTYEAFSPEGVALIIKVLTDNKNRALSNVKNIMNKLGGKMAGANSVAWMFEQKGVIRIVNIESGISNLEKFQLDLIEIGAQDFEREDGDLVIYTSIDDLQKVKEDLEKQTIKVDCAEVEFVPKKDNLAKVSDKEKVGRLVEALEDDEDVEAVFTNMR
ncbi:YebC/PmpR family DNA-binding transcriptional regulator [Patescibacteria group bacterium]|nr:YebC/PmpR family DNA-binding transcriptional regulator [Patescibacteria group bacterium]